VIVPGKKVRRLQGEPPTIWTATRLKLKHAVEVEPVGEFELKGIRRPLAAYNVITAVN
jgi:hypothetical protein